MKEHQSAGTKAPKAPFSFRRHILPPLLGILMMVGILGVLNMQWIVAQAQYRFVQVSHDTEPQISTASPNPQDPPQITIPKINVQAPIVTDERSTDEQKIQRALQRGVLHYGPTAMPGERSNIVLFGHSSSPVWVPGNYKFVFTLLEKLKVSDKIIIDYDGTRYIYEITATKVVPPTDMSVVQPTLEPQLTLVTCTPVGTSKNRLVVTAKQISPKPETAREVTSQATPMGGQLPR